MSIEQSFYKRPGDSGGVKDKVKAPKDEQIEKTEPSPKKKPDTTPDEMPEETKKKYDKTVEQLNYLESASKNKSVPEYILNDAWRKIKDFEQSGGADVNYMDKISEFYQKFKDLIPKNNPERRQRAERDIQELEKYHAIVNKAKEELGEEGSKDPKFLRTYISLGKIERNIADGNFHFSPSLLEETKQYFEKIVNNEESFQNIPNREQLIERYRILLEKVKQK